MIRKLQKLTARYRETKFFKFTNKYWETLTFPLLTLIFIALLALATNGFHAPDRAIGFSKTAFSIFGQDVRWYAVFISFGIFAAVYTSLKEVKKSNISVSHATDGVLIIIPLSILGSRLYYLLFDPNASLSSFFDFRSGGLAIHGAIIVAMISAAIYCWVRKINMLLILDIVAIGFLIGQIAGRWGNFINREAHGTMAGSLNFLPGFIREQMHFSGNNSTQLGYWHPTFLYESLANLFILISLLVVRRFKLLKVGDMFGIYTVAYGLIRGFLIEPFRQDPLWIGKIKQNVLISVLFIIGGLIYFGVKYLYFTHIPYYVDATPYNYETYLDPGKKGRYIVNEKGEKVGSVAYFLIDADLVLKMGYKAILKFKLYNYIFGIKTVVFSKLNLKQTLAESALYCSFRNSYLQDKVNPFLVNELMKKERACVISESEEMLKLADALEIKTVFYSTETTENGSTTALYKINDLNDLKDLFS